MRILLDAHLSPSVATWITKTFRGVHADSVIGLGLQGEEDPPIRDRAVREGAVVMTKDKDFALHVAQAGPPPQVILLRCGNYSNRRLCELLMQRLPLAIHHLERGAALVEIE